MSTSDITKAQFHEIVNRWITRSTESVRDGMDRQNPGDMLEYGIRCVGGQLSRGIIHTIYVFWL
jgi:hypothetical protein